jgi:TRAP-type C4-dicarboxylate transport system permease small subunit
MHKFARLVDSMSMMSGKLCAWLMFMVGFFISYEVIMRYVFTSPTVWVDEISRILLVWGTYLGGGYLIKTHGMVTIEVMFKSPNSLPRKLAETVAIAVLLIFALTAAYFGYQLWWKSTLAGHTTDTYLAVPKAITHASIWCGFALMSLQGIVELWRVWTIGHCNRDILEGAE